MTSAAPQRARDERGLFLPSPALGRFASKVEFYAGTGCVLWVGGTTCAQLKTARYGSFWDGGRRWFAHRWAAKFIHGFEIDGYEVDHCCPAGPNTLCVEHVQAVTKLRNLQLQWGRRQWGWDEWEADRGPAAASDEYSAPYFAPPAWLRPFMPSSSAGYPF